MIRHSGVKFSLWVLCVKLALPLGAAETLPATPLAPNSSTNAVAALLRPGRDDGRIAYITAWLLEELHYTHKPFDSSLSSRFLNQYLKMFDPQRIHFLQSDIADFECYRTNLHRLTIDRPGNADTTPAYEIFSRFLQRLEQRSAYADELLKKDRFKFNTDESIVTDRRELPYPKDLDEAKQLWRERLRYEYLQEKIGRIESEKKKAADNNAPKTNAPPAKTMEQEITDTLSHRYHRNLRVFEDWNSGDVLQTYLTALARVYDPHSEYMGKSGEDNFNQQMNLSFFGIGAKLFSDDDGYCTIQELLPGGPAIKSGKIKAGERDGDRILAVAQANEPPVDVVGMSLPKVVQMIKGPKGTEVRLTLLSANSSERKPVSLIRDEIPLEDQAAKAKLIELTGATGRNIRLGVIDLPSFYAPVGETEGQHFISVDVAKLLKKLVAEKVDGVILDLRHNGGGALEEAIKLTGLFIKDGPVVQVGDSLGNVQVDKDNDASIVYDGPLIVMTSRFSASASEIVAGALQDYGRALIVGDISTHGKGTVQNVNPLQIALQVVMRSRAILTNDPGKLKVTRFKFYRPSGVTTQSKGVLPDIVLPSVLNYINDIGESSLDNPMPPGDPIRPAEFEPVNRVAPYLTDLLMASAARVATNQDFVYIREDIEQVRRKQADKTVSLNEKQVLKEMDEDEARKADRNKERAVRPAPAEIVHELTLKQVDLPGLPPPVEKTNSVTAKNPDSIMTGTNAVAAAVTEPASDPAAIDPSEGERAEAARLDEAEHIMVDYLSVLASHSVASTTNR